MKKIQISIETATLDRLESVALMFDAYRRFYQGEPDLERARDFLGERIRKNESRIFLAYAHGAQGGEPAGFTQLYPSFSSVSMKRLWILNDLFVQPEWRKHGVGTALMEAARIFAKEDGSKGLSLATQTGNLTAQGLYVKMGYKRDVDFLHYHLVFQGP